MKFPDLDSTKKALCNIYNDGHFEISKEKNYYITRNKEIYDKYEYSDWIRGKIKSYDQYDEEFNLDYDRREDEEYRRRIGVSDWDTSRVPSPEVAERARQALEKLKQKEQKRIDEDRKKRETENKRLEEEARRNAEEEYRRIKAEMEAEVRRAEEAERLRLENERLRLEAEEKRRKQEEQILDDDRTLRDIS